MTLRKQHTPESPDLVDNFTVCLRHWMTFGNVLKCSPFSRIYVHWNCLLKGTIKPSLITLSVQLSSLSLHFPNENSLSISVSLMCQATENRRNFNLPRNIIFSIFRLQSSLLTEKGRKYFYSSPIVRSMAEVSIMEERLIQKDTQFCLL